MREPLTCFLIFAIALGCVGASRTLLWQPVNDSGVAGYNLYFGTSSGRYSNKVNAGNLITNRVTGLVRGTNYFFAVKAFNGVGMESDFSNEHAWMPPVLQGPVVVMSRCELTNVTLTWGTETAGVYRVTCRAALDQQWFGWIDLTPDLVAAGDQMEWSESMGEAARFYRVVRID